MATKENKRVSEAKRFAEVEYLAIGPIKERMGPFALHHYAEAYLDAARVLPAPADPFSPVRPYLVCHSIELSLKAYLAFLGSPMLQLAEAAFGHNLERILDKAKEGKLGDHVRLTPDQTSEIYRASQYYNGKLFEYPAVGEAMKGYPNMPNIETLLEAAATLVDQLRGPCQEVK